MYKYLPITDVYAREILDSRGNPTIEVEVLAGDVDGTAVAQVAAMGQIHAQNGVPRLRQREEGRQIGVSTGVGLNIGILAAE